MLDVSTFYLLVVMAGFVLVAVVLVHHHNCADSIKKKGSEVERVHQQLEPRIKILEKDVIDLKIELDEIQEKIDAVKV